MKLMASELFPLAHQQCVARDLERAIAHLQSASLGFKRQ